MMTQVKRRHIVAHGAPQTCAKLNHYDDELCSYPTPAGAAATPEIFARQ